MFKIIFRSLEDESVHDVDGHGEYRTREDAEEAAKRLLSLPKGEFVVVPIRKGKERDKHEN